MQYALIDSDNVVQNVIVSDDDLQTWMDLTAVLLQDSDIAHIGGTYDANAHTFGEAPPVVPPLVYQDLDAFGFLMIIQTAGGVTDDQLVAAHSDVALQAFWLKADRVQGKIFTPDATYTTEAFSVLVSTGHLTTDQVTAIKAGWPTA